MPHTVPGHYLGLAMGLPWSSMVFYGFVRRPGLQTVWVLYGLLEMVVLRFSIFGDCENDPNKKTFENHFMFFVCQAKYIYIYR